MAWTEQYRILTQLQDKYGPTAYTEDTVNYRLVGFWRDGKQVFCIGQTWDEAIEGLERMLANENA
jgi:hypothetical protein